MGRADAAQQRTVCQWRQSRPGRAPARRSARSTWRRRTRPHLGRRSAPVASRPAPAHARPPRRRSALCRWRRTTPNPDSLRAAQTCTPRSYPSGALPFAHTSDDRAPSLRPVELLDPAFPGSSATPASHSTSLRTARPIPRLQLTSRRDKACPAAAPVPGSPTRQAITREASPSGRAGDRASGRTPRRFLAAASSACPEHPAADGLPRSPADKQQRPVALRTTVEVRLTSARVLAPALGHHAVRTGRPPDYGALAGGGVGAPAIAWTWRKDGRHDTPQAAAVTRT